VAFAYADSVSMASYRFLPSASGRSPAASVRRAARPSVPAAVGPTRARRTESQSTVTGVAAAAIRSGSSSSSPQATPAATIKTCQIGVLRRRRWLYDDICRSTV